MGQATASSLGSFLLSHCLATARGAQQAMASFQAESSFFYESDDFTFEERSSMYALRLERLRKEGKALSFSVRFCRSQVTMSRFNTGTLALGKYKKGPEMWKKWEESPAAEEERTSFLNQLLLDRVLHGTENTKSLLHRLIFLAKISPDLADKRDLAEYWEQLFLNLQCHYYQGVGVTGLLLLYPTYIIQILESSSDVLYSVLRDLRDMELQKRVLALDAKILVMSHNIPARLFQQWNYKILNLPERYLNYETPHEDPVEATISECLTTLLKLSKHLLKYPKSPKNLPDHIFQEVPEFIVSQDTIGFLLECQELLSPAQFLQLFDFPLNIQMDSATDSMFPLSDRLKLHLDWAAVKGSYKKEMPL